MTRSGAWPGLPARWPSLCEALPGLGPFLVHFSCLAIDCALGLRRGTLEPLVPFLFRSPVVGGRSVFPGPERAGPGRVARPVTTRALPLLECALLVGLPEGHRCCREAGAFGRGIFAPAAEAFGGRVGQRPRRCLDGAGVLRRRVRGAGAPARSG
ncbi:hypothetical protein NDU88_011421 [Pleurodeles waltl]|uniref:Uncharacterized protein n=1 Tax=Pleurodeles waltl TaxID=8319 RepID=A0AAV7PYT6_PLEWA|nr:hypothetical protein NDU88_011421 [Pleurodeles waltl]